MKKIISFFIITFIWLTGKTCSQPYVEQNSGVTTGLTSVSDYSSQLYCGSAWICGLAGVVLKTTNCGVNWLNKSGNGLPSNIDLYNIFCVDTTLALTAGISGSGTNVYRTSNGGNNWQMVFSQPGGFIDAVWMKTPLIGFMYGDPVGGRWSLWKTSNGGVNWDSSGMYLAPAISSEAGWNNALFVRNNNIWFGTNNHRFYRSTNFGTTWTFSVTVELSTTALWFYYPDSLYGYYGGGDNVYKTTDGGASWILMTCPGTGSFAGFVFGMVGVNDYSPPMLNWTVRNDNKIYTNSYMSNWTIGYTAPAGNYWHIGNNSPFAFLGVTWAVRSNGGITRVQIFYGGVTKISSVVPESFYLSQNYPNPFNPKTKIKFSIPAVGQRHAFDLRLIIYDILGRELATLVNEQLQPGTYEAEWDGINYPSGVYLYKLITADYNETRKMVLVK